MALKTNDETSRSTSACSLSRAPACTNRIIPSSSTTSSSAQLFNNVPEKLQNEYSSPSIEFLRVNPPTTCFDDLSKRLPTSPVSTENHNLTPARSIVSRWSKIDGSCTQSLSPAQHINATAESPLCSPFKTTFGTKPKVASPGSNLYRIQGPSVRQITPTKLPNYDSDDFGNEYESDFDDSDNDPNWHPEKKRRLLVFSSDDGVEPLPDDDDDDISLPNTPTNADVQVTNPDSPNTPRLTDGKSKRSRRGKRIPLQWDRNVNQILRIKGKSYRGVKRSEDGRYCQAAVKRERKLKDRKCSKACALSKRCGEFSEEDRLSILNRFWGELTWKQKKVFVANMVDQVKMVERKKRAEDSRKKNSYRYHLKKNDARTVVCRNVDLQDKTVYEWVKNVDDGIPKEPAIRKPRESTIQVNKVNKAKQFLQDLPKLPSHYCRSTSKKSYLEPIFTTFSELFKVYVDDCKQENKPFLRRKAFRSLFDDMSLAIHRPKKDKCDICSGFEVGNISEEEYNLHIARKIDARNEKIRDKLRAETDGSVKVVSLDLQSLLLCPLLTASSMYYKIKLGCHNYTIFDLVTKEAMNYFGMKVLVI
ncbi:hypothetical protein LOTGIDRAFT_158521 [Lottia gigantea]|uniref:Uncharacterized protein n=1 Tax=Lottia gigantea TaxID=225164 RepID=V4B085_LOTGI|nr:hypothetical protein LOTGIDRAFT_158521 [Lottia gigantea]ESO99436.1 hypothetical protein LOTGIDRAFT_158521 [Lottia gigantea]